MAISRLFILVEGPDDERFFKRVFVPRLQKKYDLVKLVTYAEEKKKKVRGILRSAKQMNADLFFVKDINSSTCVTKKKQTIEQTFINDIEADKIIVVIMEIESWYLAGLKDEIAQKLLKHTFPSTDDIKKEQFNGLIPKKFDSRIDFMQELLNHFSISTAIQKNKSFKYFCSKTNLS